MYDILLKYYAKFVHYKKAYNWLSGKKLQS
ncbi:hypothetical protein OKW21_000495 [Catalinimonas alkaloidigena]|nr:hypothetical protein [Catalinimonas alkaloidigena]